MAMMRVRQIWESLRSGMWFIPTLLVIAAVVLAFALVAVDGLIGREALQEWPLLFGAGAEGSRGVLTAIAGSMITVAGVTFSITVVALSLTATQYSPRVLRNFMRDRANQVVLGVFVAVFAYCLIVLRVIRGGDEDPFVPEVAVLAGVMLGLTSIGFLIYFIHHVAVSIQAVSIIASAAHETLDAIEHLFPEDLGDSSDEDAVRDEVPPPHGTVWQPVRALRTGYLQSIDSAAVLKFARRRRTVVRMERAIGNFVAAGTPLASIAAASPPDDEAVRELNDAYVTDLQRTVGQDASFGIQQIVDIALKGLSPGVNDTTTAVICIDHLSSILARAAVRRFESPVREVGGVVRVVARGPTFRTLLSDAFDQIRRNAAGNVAALLRMLDAVEAVASVTRSAPRRRALREQAQLIGQVAEGTIRLQQELVPVQERLDRLLRTLTDP